MLWFKESSTTAASLRTSDHRPSRSRTKWRPTVSLCCPQSQPADTTELSIDISDFPVAAWNELIEERTMDHIWASDVPCGPDRYAQATQEAVLSTHQRYQEKGRKYRSC